MLHSAKLSFATAKKNVLLNGSFTGLLFMGLFLILRMLGLLHVFGISMVNFVVLFFACLFQLKRQMQKTGGYIPYLEAFLITLSTGTVAYVLFSVFLFLYSLLDPIAVGLYIANSELPQTLLPFVITFFEGSGGSIIVALALSFYTSRYEDGEAELKK